MTTRDNYDVIAAEVHRKALENLTHEMAITLIRTSGSPVVTEAKDFSTCLLDTVPEHLGFAAYVLGHFGSSLVGTRAVADLVREGDLHQGDGWLVNDPHTAGALHQGDIAVIMPTFYRGEHLGWSFANMHVLDVGGGGISGYAPGAHDVFQEGLRFAAIRIIRNGVIEPEWWHFIADNVRVPGPVINDIKSMIAANNTATRKLGEIIDEFGIERHRRFCEINKDLTEEVLRERISRIPDGVYEAVDWDEFDGHGGADRLLELRLRLEVDGSELRFAFSGVPQVDAFVNSTTGAMMGQSMSSILTTLAYGDLPVNGGIWRPIHFDLGEPGTIVNASPPAPVSNAHCEVGARAGKLVRAVLAEALSFSEDPVLRGRVSSQAHDSFPGMAFVATNQHGGTSVMFYVDTATGIGGPAQTVHDGQDAYGFTNMTGCGLPDVETHEAADPVLFLWRRLVPNTGGAGQTRGGQAFEQAYALRYSENAAGPSFNAAAQVPARGFGGGAPGAASNVYVVRETNLSELFAEGKVPTRERLKGRTESVPSKVAHMVLSRDEVYVVTGGGGGGLGDPLLRSPEAVAADVAAGYVTARVADAVYGVSVDRRGVVDYAETSRRRLEIRRARIGGEPTRELEPSRDVGVPIAFVSDGETDGVFACAYCESVLCDSRANWRESAAILVEAPITEVFAEREMYVRPSVSAPRVMLREYYCPACAGALGTDIVTEGMQPLPAPRLLKASDAGASVPISA